MTKPAILSQSVYASTAHRYWNFQWSEEENRRIYGQLASRDGIGSNLRLELTVAAGEAADLGERLRALKTSVDHRCLFERGHELADRPSTMENTALWLSGQIRGPWLHFTLGETDRLSCTVFADGSLPELCYKQNNLTLKLRGAVDPASGLIFERGKLRAAVAEQLAKLSGNNDSEPARWSQNLFRGFQSSLPGLSSIAIDLGRHESLVVHSESGLILY